LEGRSEGRQLWFRVRMEKEEKEEEVVLEGEPEPKVDGSMAR
jgi:hypothetical protein